LDLAFAEDIEKEIKQHLATGAIALGHAKALLSLERHRDQLVAANQIVKKGLSVREAEALAARLKHPTERKQKKPAAGPEYAAIEDCCTSRDSPLLELTNRLPRAHEGYDTQYAHRVKH
jgi:ParB-like chromosome segregation protein Spo0J